MSDPYSGKSFTDKQSLDILSQAANRETDEPKPVRALKFGHHTPTQDEAVESAKSLYAERNRIAETIAIDTLQKLEADGSEFRVQWHPRGREDMLWFWDNSVGQKRWRLWNEKGTNISSIIESKLHNLVTYDTSILSKLDSKARARAKLRDRIETFNPPSTCVYYSNGVFDWNEGVFRDYMLTDFRSGHGDEPFDKYATADDCSETLRLVKLMSGGNEKLERLIHAVNVINIIGVHTVGTTFKSGFFVWTCPDGYSGRTTLFQVINKANGGGLATFNKLEELANRVHLARLSGKVGLFVDERQDPTSARVDWLTLVKNLVGGYTKVTGEAKYENPQEVKGHWVVNQTLNSMDFIYGADRPLQERVVALKTCRIPDEEREAYAQSNDRQALMCSVKNASGYMLWLKQQFPNGINSVAHEVDTLKLEFLDEIKVLADSNDPLSDFMEEFVVPVTDTETNEVRIRDLQDRYSSWLRRTHPRSKPPQLKQFKSRCKEVFKDAYCEKGTGSNRKSPVVMGHRFDNEAFNADSTHLDF